jgi:hypothetical protein
VKSFSKWWRMIAVFALVTVLSLSYVKQTSAFTLIELQDLLPIEISENQTVMINATNTSAESEEAVIDIYAGDGTLLTSTPTTIAAGQTFSLPYTHPSGGSPAVIRAVVALSAANSTVSDIGVIDPSNGELVVIADGIVTPSPAGAVFLPAVQLVGGQLAKVNVANVSTENTSGIIAIYNEKGTQLLSRTLELNAGQTYVLKYTHPAAAEPASIRAVVTLPNMGQVVADIATFDVKTGNLVALLPAVQ